MTSPPPPLPRFQELSPACLVGRPTASEGEREREPLPNLVGVGERRRRRPPPQRGKGKAEMAQLGGGEGGQKGQVNPSSLFLLWGKQDTKNKRVFRPRTTFTMPLTLPGVCKKATFL